MPKAFIYFGLTVLILAMIPPALIARMRAVPQDERRIHYIQDMDNQNRFRAQHVNPVFADNRAMRPRVEGTVPRGRLMNDDHFERGAVDGAWATTFPVQVTVDQMLLDRGRERFTIYCQPCHGVAGYGDGIIHRRANSAMLMGKNGSTWVQPKNIHEPLIAEQPPGQLYNTVTHGIRNMAGYESQIPTADRWAIVAWVKTLQRSQSADIEDVPRSMRNDLPVAEVQSVLPGGLSEGGDE